MTNKIADLSDYQKNINIEFIVLKCIEKNTTKDNDIVRTYLAGDESGRLEVSVWNEVFLIGDIIYFHDGYTSVFKDKKRLFLSGNGFIRRIGRIRKEFSET
ncbi:SOSS complex subunit B1 [Nosema granulosis]|uniref:SOSS complex subunit B1 n=1 Tax=Nosema granulosis TaxID=83296 RepID=A0A9P6GYZ5_9MICR|nr:SOSS complex subunit B1 [Nosema granulosis]